MKKIAIISFLCVALTLQAADFERIYLSTDRSAYVAGDLIWCSAFSLGGTPVHSGVVYVELFSTDGTAAQSKISMIGGRGSGVIVLPASLPTGNYLLCAYTSPEDDPAEILRNAKVISIFNGFSSSRVSGGVQIGDAVTPAAPATAGSLQIVPAPAGRNATVTLDLDNTLGKAASVSVAVVHDDDLTPTRQTGIADVCTVVPTGLPSSEGDRIRARLMGPDRDAALRLSPYALISSPGNTEDIYSSYIGADGTVSFLTNNIFGHRDLVCEVVGLEEGMNAYLDVLPSFIGLSSDEIPSLMLSPSFERSLIDRVAAIPSSRAAAADTLVQFLPKRESRLFPVNDEEARWYHLEDYTRMNTLHESIIEFMTDLRWRRDEIQVLKVQRRGVSANFVSDVLVLIDGVPVLDQNAVIEMDARLLSDVLVYPRSYSLGSRSFEAVVSLITTARNISVVKFPETVRILDFEGASYPLAYQQRPVSGQDLRQTIFWHPSVEVPAGGVEHVTVQTPSYAGRFRIIVEGLDSDGRPLHQEATFEVR